MVKTRVKGRGRRGGKNLTRKIKLRGGKSKRSRTVRGGKTKRSRRRKGGKIRRTMRGGYGPGAKPVGYPYDGGNVGSWPGVYSSLGGNTNGISMSNYYPLSSSGVPSGLPNPPMSTDNVYSVQSGGAPLWLTKILPNEAVNVPRLFTSGLGNAYNSYVGQQTTTSPLPQYQPIDKTPVPLVADIPNLPMIHLQAGQAAANV